jgi:hypothetical protein
MAGVSMLNATFNDSSSPDMLPPDPLTGVVKVPMVVV